MKKEETKAVGLRLDLNTLEKVKLVAKEEDRTIAKVIERIVKSFFKSNQA